VPEISLAAVWAGPPLDDAADKWKDHARVSALVSKLAARRTPLEETEKAITEFLAGSATEKVFRKPASCCSPACSIGSMPSVRRS